MAGTSAPPAALGLCSESIVCCRKYVNFLCFPASSVRESNELKAYATATCSQGVRHCSNLGIRLWKRMLTAHGINTYLWRASTPHSTFIGILCATKGYTVLYLGTSSILTTLLYWLAANGVHIWGYYRFRIPQGHSHDFIGNNLSITLSECISKYWTSDLFWPGRTQKLATLLPESNKTGSERVKSDWGAFV